MRRATWSAVLVLLMSCFATGSASAAERLALRFREGQVMKYQYQEQITLRAPARLAGTVADGALGVLVDYTFKVTGVNPDNTAIVKLHFDRLVVQRDGRQVADIAEHQIPKQAQDLSAILNINGEVSFYKYVYLTFNQASVLEFRIVTGGNSLATHSASAEGETEVFAADLDMSSGMIRVGLPPTRVLNTPELASLAEIKLDLTPRKLFELLLLPTAPLSYEHRFVVPHRYLANEELTYKGQTDVQGKLCERVHAEVSPWVPTARDAATIGTDHVPALSGQMDYFIDSELGRLTMAKGQLRTVVQIPELGEQSAEITLNLSPRR